MNAEKHANRDSTTPERKFGIAFAFVFASLPLLRILRGNEFIYWPLLVSQVFLIPALFRPIWLRPFNRIWLGLGDVLHRIMSPVVLAALFYFVITPVGAALRLFGIDLLKIKRDPKLHSYWQEADRERPGNENMKYQF